MDEHVLAVVEGVPDVRQVNDSRPFFDLLEKRYPIGLNRIAWEKHSGTARDEVFTGDESQKSSDEVRDALSARQQMVREWFDSAQVPMEASVTWFGDNTDLALEMPVARLLELFPGLFSFPQHGYALGENGDWCLNYTMEGELFFGMGS